MTTPSSAVVSSVVSSSCRCPGNLENEAESLRVEVRVLRQTVIALQHANALGATVNVATRGMTVSARTRVVALASRTIQVIKDVIVDLKRRGINSLREINRAVLQIANTIYDNLPPLEQTLAMGAVAVAAVVLIAEVALIAAAVLFGTPSIPEPGAFNPFDYI